MRVALTTLGRNHSFHLARQLFKRKSLSAVFSAYPRFKLRPEGIPDHLLHCFPWIHGAFMASSKAIPWSHRAQAKWEVLGKATLDAHVQHRLPDCDAFVALSSTGLNTARIAKTSGSIFVCDRPCSHISYQNQLLKEEYRLQNLRVDSPVDPRIVDREEQEYGLADLIFVPSSFAFNSFLERGIPQEKLRLIPYGVDLERFPPGPPRDCERFDVVYVGNLSIQKGVRYLFDAFVMIRHPLKSLTLIGACDPEVRPMLDGWKRREPRLRVMGTMPQPDVAAAMGRSHVLVLPSIQDGFGMVIAEAMACACPVIATTNTGGPDLIREGHDGFIVPIRDAGALADRLQFMADHPEETSSMASRAREKACNLGGWDSYGDLVVFALEKSLGSRV